jgi:thioesterase domain-containing protein
MRTDQEFDVEFERRLQAWREWAAANWVDMQEFDALVEIRRQRIAEFRAAARYHYEQAEGAALSVLLGSELPTPPEVEDTQSFSERADAWLASIDDRIRALNARCGHESQPTERKP